MSAAPMLDAELLKHLLAYDQGTGDFTWLPRANAKGWNTRYAGRRAGYDWSPDGKTTYRVIRVLDWPFLAHRLAVLYMTGEWPSDAVDHRDLNGTNNRWDNLRPANKSQNGGNRLPSKNNRSGFKGVSKHAGRYRATIKGKFLGYRDTAKEAAKLYAQAAEIEFGQFARSE